MPKVKHIPRSGAATGTCRLVSVLATQLHHLLQSTSWPGFKWKEKRSITEHLVVKLILYVSICRHGACSLSVDNDPNGCLWQNFDWFGYSGNLRGMLSSGELDLGSISIFLPSLGAYTQNYLLVCKIWSFTHIWLHQIVSSDIYVAMKKNTVLKHFLVNVIKYELFPRCDLECVAFYAQYLF